MLPEEFTIGEYEYQVDQWGVIHQVPPTVTQRYDRTYVAERYDSIPDKVRQMSLLRVGFIIGTVRSFYTLLDVGYGNGDFLDVWRLCPEWHVEVTGHDVSGYPPPTGIETIGRDEIPKRVFDVVTFFDSLEHLPDLGLLFELNARHVVVTAPWCHAARLGVEWFRDWKHRRPGEHLHHFSPSSLLLLMQSRGYAPVQCGQPIEDVLRRPANGYENTFTAVYTNRCLAPRG